MFSRCPFCEERVISVELEWHVDGHFVDDDIEKDMELAQSLALAPESPSNLTMTENEIRWSGSSGGILDPSTSEFTNKVSDFQDVVILEKLSCLVASQVKSAFYKVEGGLMPLLKRCLELEDNNSRSMISGHIDHFQSIKSEDSGWGCGWRNIQMLSSHLLAQGGKAKHVMFGGSGFVPDISSLQCWLEIAWYRGFDIPAANSFNFKVHGSKKWIGTTECAALFRSFGLRARVVDFVSTKPLLSLTSDKNTYIWKKEKKMKYGQHEVRMEVEYGPMDEFVHRMEPCSFSCGAPLPEKSHQTTTNNYNGKGEVSSHQVLVEWIWNYFTSEVRCTDGTSHVSVSNKTPLYFQHDGHSRTIVGIQIQKGHCGLQDRYFLLVLDPSERTNALENSLRASSGWQKLIKRGVYTLKKPQYQLCYIDPGIANEEELERLKLIDSIRVEF